MIIRRHLFPLLALAGSLFVSACAGLSWPSNASSEDAMTQEPVPGKVMDLDAFAAFMALQPTAEQFRTRYPDVHLVMPGDIATKELRFDNSRYFAETDDQGRLIGGRFQ